MFRIVRSERSLKINYDEYVEALNECLKGSRETGALSV